MDRTLSELDWKKFSKGRALKDAPLLKALAALEHAGEPEAVLSALTETDKQIEALRKASKADKELGERLDDMTRALASARKTAEAEAKKAKGKAEQESAEDEEEAAPELLSTKMLPAMRQVRQGDVLNALVAVTGKAVAVLVSRRSISPGQRKLLTTALGVTSGVKFASGECRWEENSYTFVLQTQASGLAKKISAALLEQTGQRFKVRVRGEDPADIDDDGEEAPPAEEAASAVLAPVASEPAAEAPKAASAAQLMVALNQLTPRIKQFIEAQPARKDELLRVVAALQTQIKQQRLDEAQQTLKGLLVLLKASTAVPAASPAARPAGGAGGFAQRWAAARAAWNGAVATVDAQIAQVSAQMRASDDPELHQIAELGLPALTGNHKTPVMRALIDVEASEGPARLKALTHGRSAVAAFRAHLAGSALVQALDVHSPAAFGVQLSIGRSIGQGLDQLEAAMVAAETE